MEVPTFYNISVDESLFDISSDDEVRICKIAASFVKSKYREYFDNAHANVLKAAKIQAKIQKMLLNFAMPQVALTAEVLNLVRNTSEKHYPEFERRLTQSPSEINVANQIEAALNSVPSSPDGTDSEWVVKSEDEHSEGLLSNTRRRQVYKLQGKAQELMDKLPDVVDGLESFGILRKKAQKMLGVFEYTINPENEQEESTVVAMCIRTQQDMLTILEHKRTLVTVFESNYEVSATISFLQKALAIAEELSPVLIVALTSAYPILKETRKTAPGVYVSN